MMPRLQRRLAPATSPRAVALANVAAVALALLGGGLLFLPFHVDPLSAYADLVGEAFLSRRGFGVTLVQAAPLVLVGLGTIFAWRSGFAYLGFQGCLLAGAVGATLVGLQGGPGGALGFLPAPVLWLLAGGAGFAAGAGWSAVVGFIRARLGGTEVLVSLMMNYVAALAVQYLVTGPMRAPGDLPQSLLLPRVAWLPIVLPDTRANAGIVVALIAAVVVALVLHGSVVGYELIVTGLNPSAARFGGIDVQRRILLAALVCGGLAGLAGPVEVLGNQHRLLDGVGEGLGFVGIVAALLGKLSVTGTVVASVLYGGLTVGGNAMQRHTGLPSSVVLVIEALVVLLVLASDLFLRYRLVWRRPAPVAG
jgi:general nucleoside transport system permease protein